MSLYPIIVIRNYPTTSQAKRVVGKTRMKKVDASMVEAAAAGKMTFADATRQLGISVKTLKRVIEKNRLNVTKCNRKVQRG